VYETVGCLIEFIPFLGNLFRRETNSSFQDERPIDDRWSLEPGAPPPPPHYTPEAVATRRATREAEQRPRRRKPPRLTSPERKIRRAILAAGRSIQRAWRGK
jgi:hypothetical protein